MDNYFTQGIGDGIMVGLDPVGSLYATIANQPDLTMGGINYQRKFDGSIGYKISKSIGFSFGLTTNVLAHGLPQVAMAIVNLDHILSTTDKNSD
jgi:hypothetical protein